MSTGIDDNFAAFILTNGRPNKVHTYASLLKQGYTGKIYIIIDNEDETAEGYRQRYGDKVIMFDKPAIAKTFDTGDNFHIRSSIVFARNACFQIAKDLGIEYFIQLDDDYPHFDFTFTANLRYWRRFVKRSLDAVFASMLKYYKSIDSPTIAFAQGGDFIGGSEGTNTRKIWIKRKAMNTFFCSTSRPFTFVGRVNEDVNTYVTLGNRGALIFTLMNICIKQAGTQVSAGGMTELYRDEGTYMKSFYSVMYAPSCVRLAMMGYRARRMHHKVIWGNAVPCIVDEKYRKASQIKKV